MPLNVGLRSGKKVNILVTASTTDQEESSMNYSGEYLIETSYHNWDMRSGSTNLVVSRPSITIPNTYFYKSKLVQ